MQSLCIIAFGFCITVGLNILVMIHGWGVEPKSYFWIIIIGVIGNGVGVSIMQLANKD